MGDLPPDPEVQPLELIVGNPDPDHGPCLLNVGEVGAGTHDVTPMTMAGKARVRILDPSGAVVFKRTMRQHPAEGGGREVLQQLRGPCTCGQASTASNASWPTPPIPRLCGS
jgi:hypothetical protein